VKTCKKLDPNLANYYEPISEDEEFLNGLVIENEETSEPEDMSQDADISDVLDNTEDRLMYDVHENNDLKLGDDDSCRVIICEERPLYCPETEDISDSEWDLSFPLFDDVIPSGHVGSDTYCESDGTCKDTLRKKSVKINIERVETLRGGVITKVRRTATLEYSQAGKKFQQDADEVVQEVYDFLHNEFMDNFVSNTDFIGLYI